MMKTAALFLSILGSALAAPAVVWKNGERGTEAPLRTSSALRASDVFVDVLSVEPEASALASVVFVLGRDQDGSESLSKMAAAGSMPNVEKKYSDADAIHHHVFGVESPSALERDAVRAGAGHNVLSISLGELGSRLEASSGTEKEVEVSQNGAMSKTQQHSHKRAQALSDASVLIVSVDPRADKSALDNAIVSAIEHDAVSSVVLTAIRSHDEVKQERLMAHNRRLSMMKNPGRKAHGRRLEDQEQEEDADNNQAQQEGDDDMTGVYYVNMTPNILAGILFILLFAVVTYIGVTCMGMISGQDVYVTKMPPVGREA